MKLDFSFLIKIYTVAVVLFCSISANAQTYKQQIKYGREAFESGDYFGSQFYFHKALQLDSSDVQIYFEYAQALRLANEYKKAEKAYKKVYQWPGKSDEMQDVLFYLAQMQEFNANYFEAKTNYEKYAKYAPDKRAYLSQFAKQRTKSCVLAMQLLRNAVDLLIENPGFPLNSLHSEYGLKKMNDSIFIFSALRYDTIYSDFQVPESQLSGNIFTIKWNKDSANFSRLTELNISHEWPLKINPFFHQKSNFLYFTLCQNSGNCKLARCQMHGDKLGNLEFLPQNINLESSSQTQAIVVDEEGKSYLVFSSNRPKGQGNMDLWIAEIKANDFEDPKNLGVRINSPGNEITPFYHNESNTFYFASDWHEGLGGFDNFKAVGSLNQLSQIENLGAPLNSSKNDIFFSDFSEVDFISLVSNRDEALSKTGKNCCNDIFIHQIIQPDSSNFLDSLPSKVDSTLLVDVPNKSDLPQIDSVADLIEYLPVLFFPNDYPNPRSISSKTRSDYRDVYMLYKNLIWEYASSFAINSEANVSNIEADYQYFYENEMEKGYADLELFCELIFEQLKKGKRLELVIKGYSSPLASSTYNKNLTLRRIESIENFMLTYGAGKLIPYFRADENGVKALKFVREAYGESKASADVSDDIGDKRKSVYSLQAARERRIELISIIEH